MANSPDQKARIGDEIIRVYRDRISTGEIPAGQRLPSEGAICGEFKASRTVVREAFQQLRALGLLETRNGSGSYARSSDIGQIEDSMKLYASRLDSPDAWLEMLEFRQAIETESSRRVAERTDDKSFAIVTKAIERMRETKETIPEFPEADIAFHLAVVEASGNRVFFAMTKALAPILIRFARKTCRDIAETVLLLESHVEIYEAMLNRDGDLAAELAHKHISNSIENLRAMIKAGEL